MNKVTAFNDLFASKSTIAFSSIWAFYVFLIYGLMPIFFPQYQNDLLYWSNVMQLIALPLLAVGQRVLSQKHDVQSERIEDLHDKHDAVLDAISGKDAADAGHGD